MGLLSVHCALLAILTSYRDEWNARRLGMTDFLLFVGPWKTLYYGVSVGFAIGMLLSMWIDAVSNKRS